jgi:hypothetical protein
MQFQFDQDKAIQTMAYIVKRLGSVEKVKLMKLIYLADKQHFLRAGYPITGDRQCALPHGPIPSGTMDVLNGNIWPDPQTAYHSLHIDDNAVMLRRDPGVDRLSDEEIATLDEVLRLHGNTDTWRLVEETHRLPEYREAFAVATERGTRSATISYESILKHAGDESHYRLNRPVVSSVTVGHLLCPLTPGADADL